MDRYNLLKLCNCNVGFDIDYNGIYIFKEDGTRVY